MTTRTLFFYCILFCITALCAAAYLQYVEHLEPCPLCIMQRWALIALLVWLVIAIIHHPMIIGQRVYAAGAAFISAIGASIAARQVWLQHLPPAEVPECGPGMDFILNTLPLVEAFDYIFSGSGECATVDWTFLGQSLAMWSLLAFTVLFLLNCWLAVRNEGR